MTSLADRLLVFPTMLILAGCDPAPSVAPVVQPAVELNRPAAGKKAGDLTQRQAAFLNRLREADPQQRTIDRALLNEQNELGLIMDRSVEMDKIPALMKTMLAQMAREFPAQDLTVIAYAPTAPPRKIGTARLNGHTRDMTYTPER